VNVLVLGGTVFFGRHLVAALIARGHRVTTFNRGTHAVDQHLPVQRIIGDRTRHGNLARIPRDGWDAVIDPSSDVPAEVEATATYFASAKRYVYISSVSAYRLDRAPIDESSPVIESLDGEAPDAPTPRAYGWRKATSEARVRAVFGGLATIVRPGLIVGPYDPTDRFTYWPVRIAKGGSIVAPATPRRSVQFIDVRDVADFVVATIERGLGGIFNVTSPRGRITMGELVQACSDGIAALPIVRWIDDAFLIERGIGPWVELPLWLGRDADAFRGLLDIDVTRAVSTGLRFRPLAETIRATRSWFASTGRTTLNAGLTPIREKELLEAWNAAI
jgi:2'-hydroxyisoflavone reductase